MLNVKSYWTLFKPKSKKKAGIFTKVAIKSRALLDYFCNLVSRFSLILTKIWLSIESNASDYRAQFIEL